MHRVERVKHRLTRKIMPVRLSELGVDGFEGYASLFGAQDGIGDIVAPGAFAASLRRRGPSGVRMLYQHFAYEPIGVWDEIKEDARGLYVRGRLVLDVERARDVAALLREGALGGLSIGFKTVRARKEPANGTRTLLQVGPLGNFGRDFSASRSGERHWHGRSARGPRVARLPNKNPANDLSALKA